MISHEDLIELGFELEEFENMYYKQINNNNFYFDFETKNCKLDGVNFWNTLGKATTKEQLENLIKALIELE